MKRLVMFLVSFIALIENGYADSTFVTFSNMPTTEFLSKCQTDRQSCEAYLAQKVTGITINSGAYCGPNDSDPKTMANDVLPWLAARTSQFSNVKTTDAVTQALKTIYRCG